METMNILKKNLVSDNQNLKISDSESSGAECDYNDFEGEEDDFVSRRVIGLFSDREFENVNELFNYEASVNHFNIIDILDKFNMDMISYIKMINYIRKEVFHLVNLNMIFRINLI